MFSYINNFFNHIFPLVCVFCGIKINRPYALCDGCEVDLPWLTRSCKQCALSFEVSTSLDLLCPECQLIPPPFEKTCALFHYQHPINHLITQLKFHHKLLYAKLFGSLLAKSLRHMYREDSYPSIIIPMPLHHRRLKERGFNQALEIARPIAKELQIPLNYKICKRIKATATQSSQSSIKQRENNVKNAFAAKPLHGEHVLIIDDVMTTGSTVRELAKELLLQGASRVDVACCARV